MKITTAFRKINELKGNIRVVQGSAGSSKTYSILQLLILTAIQNRNSTLVSIVSESMPHLKRGAMRDFVNILTEMGLYNEKQHNKTENRYRLGRTRFEFFGANEPSKLRGARRDILFVNEANNISEEAFHQLQMRTRTLTFLDFNPSHLTYIRDLIEDDKSNFVILNYLDNEYLPENTIQYYQDKIKKAENGSEYWKNWVKVYVYGIEGQIEGAIFTNWKEIDRLPDDAKLLACGLDFGFANDECAVSALYQYDGEYIIDEIIYQKGLLNNELAKLLIQKGLKNTIIYADSAEPKSIKELNTYGLNVVPVKKGKDSVNYGINLMQQTSFRVVNSAVNLIKELNNYTWAKTRNGERLNIPIDNYNHLIDSIRYIYLMRMGKKQHFGLKMVG
ncbi:PBSX family phage terminase large subunit [Galbibacter pacificus]|uniref:Terminase large subunit n=1 Tax=Galbibacter pacificus TaxID=2996052 RepID=A0ABT6FR73_9FLAO|nr:terminase large subunit [Galbibacter pacificus]MDG3581761.1 terminase large subunit [Galbibacter pacificus]MDG3585765.1 terminase large subunit [Galbibacter pacificus]